MPLHGTSWRVSGFKGAGRVPPGRGGGGAGTRTGLLRAHPLAREPVMCWRRCYSLVLTVPLACVEFATDVHVCCGGWEEGVCMCLFLFHLQDQVTINLQVKCDPCVTGQGWARDWCQVQYY